MIFSVSLKKINREAGAIVVFSILRIYSSKELAAPRLQELCLRCCR